MTIYYVATLARYVLVEADDEAQAREKAVPYLGIRQPITSEAILRITTVRPATTDEIELSEWHDNMVAREAANKAK
jgi:hypothetical protein